MNSTTRGALYGIGAYGLWGVFPLYFRLLERSGAVEVVVHRVLWSLLVCLGVVAATRGWSDLAATLTAPRRVLTLGVGALLLAVNWGVYVYAVNSGQVVEASLGYFVNPLVTVLLGVLVLRERLRPWQWGAVGIGTVAVGVLTLAYGRPPLIALALALTFGLYGLIKNRVGAGVGAVTSLTTETVVLALPAALLLAWLGSTGQGHFTADPPWQGLLLASAGVATVVPLLFFAASARRVPLSTLGLLQYLTPVLQLACGVLLLGERMPPARWAGFALVWAALVVLTLDTLRTASRRRQVESPAAEPVGVT
ncbi:MAG TPA: EamA family transporter RarD [Kineosporiaceae bacterium]|nr:EamA family transporter RarD [Kineosporiaceae bacterium]